MINLSLEKLKKLRVNAKLTYQQVADLAGISKEYYWFIENGKRRLTYEMAIKIARVFNRKPDDIFFEELVNQ